MEHSGYEIRRPLVLFVEQQEDTRALYSLALSAMGFDVVPAPDAIDGYRRAQEMHPDVIVTDLPADYDHWQFLQDLKQNPCTRDIPRVAFFSQRCPPDELAAGLRQLLEGAASAGGETSS